LFGTHENNDKSKLERKRGAQVAVSLVRLIAWASVHFGQQEGQREAGFK